MPRVTVRQRPDRRFLQLAFTDPITGEVKTRSAKTTDWRQAEREAARWEAEIESTGTTGNCSWSLFRDRFEIECLGQSGPATRSTYITALNHFENHVGKVRDISSITSSVVSRFRLSLEKSDLAPATVGKILRHVRAALAWAHSVELIRAVPRFRLPAAGGRQSKGRPITDAEFALFVEAVPRVIASDLAGEWQDLLRFLWLSGLRISEALKISWDSPPVQIDFDGRRPKIRWRADGQKNRKDDLSPIPPDLAEFLDGRKGKSGRVFELRTRHPVKGDVSISARWASRKIAAIGRESGVMVSTSKHVSAHDLRRTFGTRWALKVHPVVLRKMMRHSTMETTMAYYVDIDADDVADQIWDLK